MDSGSDPGHGPAADDRQEPEAGHRRRRHYEYEHEHGLRGKAEFEEEFEEEFEGEEFLGRRAEPTDEPPTS
jgi:hypothetical protein